MENIILIDATYTAHKNIPQDYHVYKTNSKEAERPLMKIYPENKWHWEYSLIHLAGNRRLGQMNLPATLIRVTSLSLESMRLHGQNVFLLPLGKEPRSPMSKGTQPHPVSLLQRKAQEEVSRTRGVFSGVSSGGPVKGHFLTECHSPEQDLHWHFQQCPR